MSKTEIDLGLDHSTLLKWQRLPTTDQLSVSHSPTSHSDYDQSMPERPSSLARQLFLSIEHSPGDDTCDGSLGVPDDDEEAKEYLTNPRRQPLRDDTSSGTSRIEYVERQCVNPDSARDTQITITPAKRPIAVQVPQSTLTQPRSLFEGFVPPAIELREEVAVAALVEAAKSQQSSEDEYLEFELHDFTVYINQGLYIHELRPLQHLAVRHATERMYFDGVVSCSGARFYLRKIPFQKLPIGNYGIEEHTVGDQLWIRSDLNERSGREIYYKLMSPSAEYARFHKPFLWIADLTKHVLDYCDHLKQTGHRAVLFDFKSRFSIWLLRQHWNSTVFERWHSANRGSDFRGAIIANVEFIWREAYGLDPKNNSWHTLWAEIKSLDRYTPNLGIASVPYRPTKHRRPDKVPHTTVTPYVYDLFSHMVFGKVLKEVKPSALIDKKQSTFIQNSRPVEQRCYRTAKRDESNRSMFISSIEVGDVISTKPDDDKTNTKWKQAKSQHYDGEHLWFGLVQKVHQSRAGNRSFDVIWLYQSVDTPCGVMKYPWKNELFLSNNCTCHHDTAKVKAEEILSTHSVEWFGEPSTPAEFFVRQTYLSDDCRWTTLKREHFTCAEDVFHEDHVYKVNDAVLVEIESGSLRLEPFLVEAFFDKDSRRYARLRRLLRRRDYDRKAPNAPPNELVYTDQLVEISSRRIFRHCLVRAFHVEETIPTPYDCNGTGDLFFMTHQEIETDNGDATYAPLDTSLVLHLRQGFNPFSHQSEKLQGLDLFCGGGNFGRGLEDGSGIEMRWANDIWSEAIHTYIANSKPDACTPFLGSVDDLFVRALQGDNSKIPRPGEVHFISAGSPCPGFSLLTPDKTTDDQRKNQSLVASFASFVDLYRPYYGLLENVPQMVNSKNFRHSCVFSQLVCALVGLGYQTQVMFLDAWSFGAPQSRSRVFLCFSAPGFRMPRVPAPSHSHPPGTRLTKLGEMSCGRPFDSRKLVPTPFRYVGCMDAMSDLPDIRDGKADYCVGFPDHRLSIGYTPPMRMQLLHIPTQPWGMSFSKAWHGLPWLAPVMSASERAMFPADPSERARPSSKGWTRVHPHQLVCTIAATCLPSDARIGQTNHWDQPRPLTILEARRAQGFRDHEVLVGTPANQWRIIGNSVARQVSLALGLAIREAWLGTLFDEPRAPQMGLASATSGTSTGDVSLPSYGVVQNTGGIEGNSSIGINALAMTCPDISDSLSTTDTPSDDPFLAPKRPRQNFSLTPATTTSYEGPELKNMRKRRLAPSVELLSKRSRLDDTQVSKIWDDVDPLAGED
ncbi:S-adenosyl-L-methionine-dependent methyltransferase [Hypoxylon sp. NC1633]|nr:S-adenosyl-L-methionine-dependent methyltransferase [Hypoxylon sp. NC1633]